MPRRRREQVERARSELRALYRHRLRHHSPRRRYLEQESTVLILASPLPPIIGLFGLIFSLVEGHPDWVAAAGGAIAALGVARFGVGLRERVDDADKLPSISDAGVDDAVVADTLSRQLLREAEISGLRLVISGTLIASVAPLAWRMLAT